MPRQSLSRRADGRYRVKYKDQYFYGQTQTEALLKRDEYRQAEREGLKSHCPTVAAYAAEWLPAHKKTVSVKCYNDYAKQLDALCSVIGSFPLSIITPTDIKRVYSEKYEGYSNYTIKRARMIYNALFDSAVADGYIRVNPCRDKTARPHKGEEGTHRELTAEEDALLFAVDHPLRPAVMLMRYAGLRRGEALALNAMHDIDYSKNEIHVRRAVSFLSNQPIIKKPKTDAGTRTVPLFEILRREIEGINGYIAKSKKRNSVMSESAFRSAWASYIHAVECHINGYTQKRWYGNTREDKAIIEAGGELPPWKTFDIRPHDLRHSFCTMLRDAGVDMHLTMEWMGHGDEKMVLKIYDHVNEDRRKKAVKSVEKIMLGGQNGGQE
jgi:integrase